MKKTFFKATLSLLTFLYLFLMACAPTPSAALFSYDFPMQASANTLATPKPLDYACILTDDTFFYADADEKRGLFLLPKSYYVRLVEYGNEYCKVEYQKNESEAKRLIGYAKTAQLTFVNYVPLRPYLYYVFDLRYTIEGAPSDDDFLTQITLPCVYYGDYRIGSETYCYVLRDGKFGYVPKPSGVTYEENTEYADWLQTQKAPDNLEDEPPMSETNTEKNSPAQIAILITVCLLVPVLAALILKPPRRPPYLHQDD